MTTITINIPDHNLDIISELSEIIKSVGGNLSVQADDLSNEEMELVKSSFKEALLIRDGKLKSVPVSELWND